MKTLMIVIFLISSTLWGFDYISNDYDQRSWQEIEADNSKLVSWPTYMGVPINKLCITPTKIRSLEPVRSCGEWKVVKQSECKRSSDWCFEKDDSIYTESQQYGSPSLYYKCAKIMKSKNLEFSRYTTMNSCVSAKAIPEGDYSPDNYSCKHIKSERILYPQTHEVTITDTRGESQSWGTKKFHIPQCH